MNFPIIMMPRRLLDLDNLINTTIDIFDPFDELDQELCRDISWLRKPILREKKKKPNVPSKYRLNIDVQGYRPETLNTEIEEGKLLVSGCDEVVKGEDFTKRQFQKSFKLPDNIDEQKMISFVTKKGNMIIEIPYKKDAKKKDEPKIEEKDDGSGTIVYTMDVKHLDINKLQVTLKDFDVIINYEELLQLTGGKSTRITNVKEFTLPENTDMKSLKCVYDRDCLRIEASLLPEPKITKIPIYYVEKQPEKPSEQEVEKEEKREEPIEKPAEITEESKKVEPTAEEVPHKVEEAETKPQEVPIEEVKPEAEREKPYEGEVGYKDDEKKLEEEAKKQELPLPSIDESQQVPIQSEQKVEEPIRAESKEQPVPKVTETAEERKETPEQEQKEAKMLPTENIGKEEIGQAGLLSITQPSEPFHPAGGTAEPQEQKKEEKEDSVIAHAPSDQKEKVPEPKEGEEKKPESTQPVAEKAKETEYEQKFAPEHEEAKPEQEVPSEQKQEGVSAESAQRVPEKETEKPIETFEKKEQPTPPSGEEAKKAEPTEETETTESGYQVTKSIKKPSFESIQFHYVPEVSEEQKVEVNVQLGESAPKLPEASEQKTTDVGKQEKTEQAPTKLETVEQKAKQETSEQTPSEEAAKEQSTQETKRSEESVADKPSISTQSAGSTEMTVQEKGPLSVMEVSSKDQPAEKQKSEEEQSTSYEQQREESEESYSERERKGLVNE